MNVPETMSIGASGWKKPSNWYYFAWILWYRNKY